MNIKDRLLAYMPAQDELGHFFVCVVAADFTSLVAMATAALHFNLGPTGTATAGFLAAVLTAFALSVAGEKLDQKANEDAAANGEQPKHTVSRRDIVAGTLGGVAVALPLLALLALLG